MKWIPNACKIKSGRLELTKDDLGALQDGCTLVGAGGGGIEVTLKQSINPEAFLDALAEVEKKTGVRPVSVVLDDPDYDALVEGIESWHLSQIYDPFPLGTWKNRQITLAGVRVLRRGQR